MTTKDVGARISARRKELNMTLQDVADRVSVARSTIQRYEAGTIDQMKIPVIHSIARALSVNPEWLIGKSDEKETDMLPDNIIPMPQHYNVPLIGEIACGKPILAVEDAVDTVLVPDHVHADFALRCKGNSMINARIYDGDIVYIRQQESVDDGTIAAVLVGDEATLKRVRFFDNRVVLEAANPLYEPLVYWREEMDSVRILGRAVAFTSMIN